MADDLDNLTAVLIARLKEDEAAWRAANALAVEVINGNPAERIYIIAPDYQRFGVWCLDHDINRHSPNVFCVTRERDLYGVNRAWYVFVGVPDGMEGRFLLGRLEHMKATGALKNADG